MIRCMYKIGCSVGEWYSQYLVTYDFASGPWILFWKFYYIFYECIVWGEVWIAEKSFREAATGHVHWRTLVAVAERFL